MKMRLSEFIKILENAKAEYGDRVVRSGTLYNPLYLGDVNLHTVGEEADTIAIDLIMHGFKKPGE